MAKLPNRRPHYMVKARYEEPHRGYALTLFCGCGIEPASGRIVEVFVNVGREHDGETPDMRDAMLERTLNEVAMVISFHLQMGVFAQALAQRMDAIRTGSEGPGYVTFPSRVGAGEGVWVASPIGAIVQACVVAQQDWRQETAHLAREGVVHHV